MPLTGNVVLVTLMLFGNSTPCRKLKVVNGRRGPIAPDLPVRY
jgi:hypothetical protein